MTVSDILVGDVWLASGQSNMEMPLSGFPNSAELKNGPEEIAHATLPNVRLLRVEKTTSEFPLNDVSATWTECNPQTAAEFSAVAYFFGREISEKEKVPVGLIDTTWGGTPVESWISLMGISSDAEPDAAVQVAGAVCAEPGGYACDSGEGEARARCGGGRASASSRAALASESRVVGAGGALQRHDRSGDAVHDQRRDLVSGRDEQRSGAGAAVCEGVSGADCGLAEGLGAGEFSIPVCADFEFLFAE